MILNAVNKFNYVIHEDLPLAFRTDDLTIYTDRLCFAIVQFF